MRELTRLLSSERSDRLYDTNEMTSCRRPCDPFTARGATVLLVLSACACAPTQPLSVRATGTGGICRVEIDGVEMLHDNLDYAKLRTLADAHRRRMVLDVDANTPYRCIGGVVFNLQRAGFRGVSLTVNGVPLPAQ